MSSSADSKIYDNSVEQQENVNLFESKKWTYITDTSSNNGAFTGQLQFDLNTLSSQNQWTSLSEAYVTFPVKLTIKNNTTTNLHTDSSFLMATIKNGFHQFVDSIQIVIGGNTIQSSQIFTNIDANYRILTEWDGNTLTKYGSTLGVSLDDYVKKNDAVAASTDSLDNFAQVTSASGFRAATANNVGLKERLSFFNNSSDTSLGKSILGSSQSLVGKSNVQISLDVNNADCFVLHALGTIRLADLSDAIDKMPLVKGLRGFIYINYNASTSTVTTSAGTPAVIASVSNTSKYGRCAPAILNVNTGGIVFDVATATSVDFTAEISGTASATLTTAQPIATNAVLYAPYYNATPEVDRSLSMKKTIRYNERFVTQFNVAANGNFSGTLSPGISNPKRIILYPYFTGAGSSGNTGFLTNPLISPFDAVPSCTSPFAAIKDLQFYVGNVPMFQSPQNFDFAQFLNEVAENGIEGGKNNEVSSGLLSQRMWNQAYRYYTCNVGRRMNSEDGASKSVICSLTNATTCPMTVIAIIWYEKECVVDTASGQIQQTM